MRNRLRTVTERRIAAAGIALSVGSFGAVVCAQAESSSSPPPVEMPSATIVAHPPPVQTLPPEPVVSESALHAAAEHPEVRTGAPRAQLQLGTDSTLTASGYIETFYQWNTNQPSNGITNFRGFDNRHNTFTVSNIQLQFDWTLSSVSGHLALQVGHTPDTYYLSEPYDAYAPTSADQTSKDLWKFVQQANFGWRAPIGRGLLVEAGIFLSPVGPESIAVRDSWNYSRSDLFYGLPFYHTGIRVGYPFSDNINVSFAVFNGWNSVVDNNPEKTIAAQFTYNLPNHFLLNFVYMGGNERSPGAAEGKPWRSLFDLYAFYYPTSYLSFLVQLDAGIEPNALGTAGWYTGALYARVQPIHWLYLVARGDYFAEVIPNDPRATPIFWNGAHWVASVTGTVDVRPVDTFSIRLEARHDAAETALFYRGAVPISGGTTWATNATDQTTFTLGFVGWF